VKLSIRLKSLGIHRLHKRISTEHPEEGRAFWMARMTRPIFFFTIVLAVAGGYLATQMPSSVFPSTDFPRVVIGIDNGVMPVDQMQVTITKPIEDAVNSVPGLLSVQSITSRGSAEVDLFFNWKVNMVTTLELVDAALAKVQQSLPATVQIRTNRLTFATFPLVGYSLTSDTLSPTALWELAYYNIKPILNRVTDVSTVQVMGGRIPEFHVVPQTAKLQAAGVTISALVSAIENSNLVQSPGLYESNHQLTLGLVGAQARNVSQLANLAVKTTAGGVPVHIGDVAEVRPGTEPVYTIVTANGRPSVLLNIVRQPASNSVAVADAIAVKVAQIQKSLPAGVQLRPFYDQTQLVRDSIKSVRDAILIGLVLAAIVLVLFLRDWTSSIIAGLVIPSTILITFIFLYLMGESFNLMTLGGLAAAVGLVIDDAIVVVENIVMHRDMGESRIEAVRKAFHEITPPLIASTITPIVVFVPLISVTGVTGVFFRALAITMSFALLTSLALALTWTPSLSLVLLRRHRPPEADQEAPNDAAAGGPVESHEDEHQGRIMGHVLSMHARLLSLALARPLWLAVCCCVLVVGAYFGYKNLGSDMLPAMDEGGFTFDYIMPAGASLTETNRVLNHVEHILLSIPEVENISRRTGLQLGLAAVTEANTGDISVLLKKNRTRGIDAIMAEVRDRVHQSEPELDIELSQVLEDIIGDLSGTSSEPIQIKLFSNNQTLLNQLGPKVADAIGKIPGIVDVENGVDNTISGPATSFQVDPAVAARLGFTPQEVSADMTAILDGIPTPNPVIINDQPYTVRVRFGPEHRSSLNNIVNTIFNSSTGHIAPLGSLVNIVHLPPQNEILRDNLQQLITVTARLQGSNLGSAIASVKRTVDSLHLPSDVRVEYGGTYQTQQDSFHQLVQVLLLALVLVFGVLLVEFHNFSAPVAILTSSVLSTAGVVIALLLTGITFSVSSFMGLIMVIGIVAKNGILLLDADQKFRDQGMNPHEAMMQAARRRLRPILMTAVAAICGMLPLAFALGAGSKMLQPLAVAVIGGLLISMVLSLVVTPAVYYFLTGHA